MTDQAPIDPIENHEEKITTEEEHAPQPEVAAEVPPESKVAELPPRPESRFRSFLRGFVRWTLGILVVFFIGVAAALLLFYRPVSQKLTAADQDISQANQQIADQTTSINRLTAENTDLKKQVSDIQTQVSQLQTQLALVQALSDARSASLAIADKDSAGAQLAVTQLSHSLDLLAADLGADHADIMALLKADVQQASQALRSNLASGRPILDRLVTNLTRLEDTLTTSP